MQNKLFKILLFIIILTISLTSISFANTVEYRGGAEGLVSAPDDFFLDFGELMPGDTREDSAVIFNSTSDEVEFFFKTEPLLRSEFSDDADYSLLNKINLKISFKSANSSNVTTIYDGNLGAESLSDFISLGTFSKDSGGELIFSINVPSDLKNCFTLANTKVKWVFAVEKKHNENEIDNKKETENEANNAQTGDFIYYIIAALVCSLALLVAIYVIRFRRNNYEK